ncbi:MAG TPA: FtsQ-type POTRA domain-containing protein [Opitutaceae bacterium]|nr:FtsQ-type POTRA domain-containing protein [Opitutaceae bacterium]
MTDSSEHLPIARSWRDIPQEVKARSMSKSGRRRHALALAKMIGGTGLAGVLVWGAIELVTTIEQNPKEIARDTQSVPVKHLELVSDQGALDRAWLERTLALPKGVTLMELDLAKLQAKVLANSQVRTAVLTKSFPDKLTVAIVERTPIARLKAQLHPGELRDYLVARDGMLFDGLGYADELRDTLPWLDLGDARLTRRGEGFAPIEGMAVVADLLAKAKAEAEHLYRTFQVVSLARLASDDEIEVRTTEMTQVIFSTRDDFFRQLAKLDRVRDEFKPTPELPLAKVDLSLGQFPVVAGPGSGPGVPLPPAGTAAAGTARAKPAVAAFPSFQRKSSPRDL